jgi:hypothetical protein
MSLPESENRNPYVTTALVCARRYEGKSNEEIVKELSFDSVEQMQTTLQNWKLPGWLVGSEADSGYNSTREKSKRRARDLDPRKELPPAGNATVLFKERLERLLKEAELLKHMDEGLHGRHFVRQDVDLVPLLLSRDYLSKEGWEEACEQYGLDPEGEVRKILNPNALAILPGGVALSPSETVAILIAVYALAGGDMDALLDALHPDGSSVGAEAREEIRRYVEGSRADGDKRDGLKVLARQLATWVRGSEVGPGRPSGLSKADHEFACSITRYREQGLTYEEIARKETHRKKEDGTSYTIKDVTELGELGLRWS